MKFLVSVSTENALTIGAFADDATEQLKQLQEAVGGYIKTVRPEGLKLQNIVMICNEEGLTAGKSINPTASRLYGFVSYGEPIFGNVAFLKHDGGENLIGLDDGETWDLILDLVENFGAGRSDDHDAT